MSAFAHICRACAVSFTMHGRAALVWYLALTWACPWPARTVPWDGPQQQHHSHDRHSVHGAGTSRALRAFNVAPWLLRRALARATARLPQHCLKAERSWAADRFYSAMRKSSATAATHPCLVCPESHGCLSSHVRQHPRGGMCPLRGGTSLSRLFLSVWLVAQREDRK